LEFTENFSIDQRNTENNEIIKDFCTGNLPELILQKNSPNKAYKNYDLFLPQAAKKQPPWEAIYFTQTIKGRP